MSTAPATLTDVPTALAAFDSARDAFLAAFARAPNDALGYVPTGDEYAIGVLVMHLVDPMDRYMSVFDLMRCAGFGRVDFSADAERTAREASRHADLVAARPTGADRQRLIDELQAAHQRVRTTVGTLDADTFARQAPVIYTAGADPYPTSCRDIMGWLIDHYAEHTTQIADLLADWRRQGW
jgi:DinB superfamily